MQSQRRQRRCIVYVQRLFTTIHNHFHQKTLCIFNTQINGDLNFIIYFYIFIVINKLICKTILDCVCRQRFTLIQSHRILHTNNIHTN